LSMFIKCELEGNVWLV